MKHILACIAMSAAVMTAVAQPTAHTPPTAAQMAQHEVERYSSQLSLTSEQQEQATIIFTAAAASEATLRAEQHTARQALDTSITTGDAATIGQAATMLGQLEGELTSARSLAQAKLYKILTADQQTNFVAMLDRPMGPGAPHGPGGHGDHGGPPPAR